MRFSLGIYKLKFCAPHVSAGLLLSACFSTAVRAGEVDTLLFGSLDAGAATFLTLGAKAGLSSLDRDGAVALASIGGGRTGERGPDGPRQRYTANGAVMIGYQWFFDWGVIAAFAGPEVSAQMLQDGQIQTWLPACAGFRLQGEVWARPTEATLLQATLIAGTALDSLWARMAWGYRLWGAYLGPELSLYTDATGYRKWNLGLHGTDFSLDRYSFRISAGVQSATDRRTVNPYLALAVWSPW